MSEQIKKLTLAEISAGENATVLSFQSGCAINQRLISMGFTPGVKIKIIQNRFKGPLIVLVRGTRVALGRGEAVKIIVERGSDAGD